MTRIDLQGKQILVIRPFQEGEAFCRLIDSCNGRWVLAPALEILPPLEPEPFNSALKNLSRYDGLLITSVNGARSLLARIKPGQRVPPFFAVGKKTAKIIQEAGYSVVTPDQPLGGEALAEAVQKWQPGGGCFLFPQAEKGREELLFFLTEAGYQIDRVVAYRAEPVRAFSSEVLQALSEGRIDAIPFFSGRSAQAFLRALPPEGEEWLKKTLLIALSPITKKSLDHEPIIINLISQNPTGEGLLTTLQDHWKQKS
jgi:uroporphyrinogen-III synthase